MSIKPTIFFSHSAHDSRALKVLKERFCARTDGTIDVFLSSDGSSIPFGHNWQKTIENALERCTLMFTFLTPQSVASRWIYFESGYAYARGKRVVPVGLEGVDLAQQPPPLQLLNGFNIRDHEGLNNIISITNEVFSQEHPLSFDQSDYDQIVQHGRLGPTRALGPHGDDCDLLVVGFETTNLDPSFWSEALFALPGSEVVAHMDGEELHFLGLRISAHKGIVNFVIDRLGIDAIYPLVENLLIHHRALVGKVEVKLYLKPSVRLEENDLRESAALIGTGWRKRGKDFVLLVKDLDELSMQTRWYRDDYDDDECAFIQVAKSKDIPALDDLRTVLNLCFDVGLLTE